MKLGTSCKDAFVQIQVIFPNLRRIINNWANASDCLKPLVCQKLMLCFSIQGKRKLMLISRYRNIDLASVVSKKIVTGRRIHNYNITRTSSHFRSHACRTNTKQFTILVPRPKIWNSLPNSITSIFLLQSFKMKVFFFDFLLYR